MFNKINKFVSLSNLLEAVTEILTAMICGK